jgi:hypothetical protein
MLVTISIAMSTTVFAQQTAVHGNASAQSRTAVSADRRGANVATDNRGQSGITTPHGENGVRADQQASGIAGGSQMSATLERSIDARRAKPGDEVTAKTSETFTTASGVTIPRGSRIVGHVTEARPYTRGEGSADGGSASQLGIVFDKAVLKDGREIPMETTIQALAAARSQAHSDFDDAGAFGGARPAAGSLGGGALGGLGGAGGAVAGHAAGNAGAVVSGATRIPRPAIGTGVGGAGNAAAHGGAVLGSSAGAVGGLSSAGEWLANSHGVFGLADLGLVASAAGGANGSLITSASRTVRLESGTQLLLVGSAGAAGR